MANIYKKPVLLIDRRTGRKVKTKSKKWWGRFRDEHGNEERVPLATDRAVAQTLLAEHVKKVERKLAGVQPKAAQTLARHSDINLTMNTYTMLKVLDQAAAVESLPPVPSAVEQDRKFALPPESHVDPAKIDAEHAVPVDPASLPPDIARILAAWEQLPLEVKNRLAASISPPVALRLAR